MPTAPSVVYERRRPEATTLYRVVQENPATLYGAVDDGALATGDRAAAAVRIEQPCAEGALALPGSVARE